MMSLLYKWFFLVLIWGTTTSYNIAHPFYVSVTEIEHNAKDKTLEISCKIFTDDFEKTLRAAYKTHIDLLKPSETAGMNKLVDGYLQKHLKITANGKIQQFQFKGYEQIEEAIYCYFQVDNIAVLKTITVVDNILYDYQQQQTSILHVTVNGNRKSTKMINPEDKVSFEW